MRKLAVFTTIFAFIFPACHKYQGEEILGEWQAVAILEEGAPIPVDPAEVRLSFQANDHYTYHSTLNYQEAGTYLVYDNYLFTTDTLNQASTEKAVEITKLSEDSLFLKMNESGKERLVKMVRQGDREQ